MYSKELLKKLYISMIRMRLCEESFIEPILRKEVRCPVHLYVGEEAISAGIGAALSEKDKVFSNHRSHGHYLAKGGDLKELIAEVYGKETGCARGRGGSMHLIYSQKGFLGSAPIVAGTISLAMGAALASKIENNKSVAVTFFGDGATGEGVLYECLNFSALKKLPLIFACENNFYSTHLPLQEIRVNDNIWRVAEPFGIPSYRVDGNDVLGVYKIARKAIKHARSGRGPVFIEFRTYRLRGHVGPDDNIQGSHTDIRPKKEVEAWRKKDPVICFEKYLIKNDVITRGESDNMKEEIVNEIIKYHRETKDDPYPKTIDLNKYVFKE